MKRLVYFFMFVVFYSCSRKNIYQETEIQCLGAGNNNGSVQLKIWSYGVSQTEAVNTAKMKAVDAVLFKGISQGSAGCPSNPIISDLTIKTKEKKFFEKFYAKNGPYNQFVTLSGDGSINPKDRLKVSGKVKIGIYVVVNHRGLKSYMENLGFSKKLSSGF